jgi:mono/diheme cytochrome c family protein
MILEEDMRSNFSASKKLMALVGVLVLFALVLTACSGSSSSSSSVPKPSNAGTTGDAVKLTGDAAAGAKVFSANCVACHGDQGKIGVANPGAKDGTVPSLNPIDPGLVNADAKVFAANIDLFIEHGSTPEGTPALKMLAFGDQKTLTPQQIADVIAYVISLNKK